MELALVRVVFEFYPDKGGSITHVIELSKKIHSSLSKQIIIAPVPNGNYREFDQELGIPIRRVNYMRFKRFKSMGLPVRPLELFSYGLNVVRQIKKMIREGCNVGIIHVHSDLLGAFIVMCLKIEGLKIPVVIMRHGGVAYHWAPKSLMSLQLELALFSIMKPDYFIVLDDGTDINKLVAKLCSMGIRNKVVYHGIDTSFFSPNGSDGPRSEFIILSTHRLIPEKRLDFAILAFKRFMELSPDASNVKLHMIGSGPLSGELAKLAKDNQLSDNVIFISEKNPAEIKSCLVTSDVVIGTALESNMNRSIQEAMACEKPVIVFDSGGTNKLIKNMENGILVAPGDINDFAEKIKLLLEDAELRHKLGKNARKSIISQRNWDTRIAQELKVYEETLNTKA